MVLKYVKSRWKVIIAWCCGLMILYVWINGEESAELIESSPWTHNLSDSETGLLRLTRLIATKFTKDFPSPADRSKVLILSYQRCGSSFFGQLFNQNPEAFYVFEPGDSVYMSQYATAAGWNVPSDVTHLWNGSKRVIPEEESSMLAETVSKLFYCDMAHISTEFYLHSYWHKFPESLGRLYSYKKCLSSLQGKADDADMCRDSYISDLCPQRFGENMAKHRKCRVYLNGVSTQNSSNMLDQADLYLFREYSSCLKRSRHKVSNCIDHMEYVCNQSSISSVKTVRATMDTAKELLAIDPDIKILHLIRDPRAVVKSRMTRPSFQGHYSGKNMVKEAQLYCEDVADDIIKRRDLEQQYPGTFMEVIYEDFISNPLPNAEKVYEFIGEEMPWEVSRWLYGHTILKKNSSRIAEKWQESVPYRTTLQINKHCERLFNLVNYTWP